MTVITALPLPFVDAEMQVKRCPDCRKLRPITEFYSIQSRYDGLSSYCKKHQLEHDRKYRDEHREEHNAYMREYMRQERGAPKAITTKKVNKDDQVSMLPGKHVSCTCHQYQTCMVCRNAERRRAWKSGDIPAYRLAALAALVGERG